MNPPSATGSELTCPQCGFRSGVVAVWVTSESAGKIDHHGRRGVERAKGDAPGASATGSVAGENPAAAHPPSAPSETASTCGDVGPRHADSFMCKKEPDKTSPAARWAASKAEQRRYESFQSAAAGKTPKTDAVYAKRGHLHSPIEAMTAHARQLEQELALVERRLASSEELRTGLAMTLSARSTTSDDVPVCCEDFHRCTRPCTPRGRWLAEQQFAPSSVGEKPVAWRYRLKASKMAWRYVDHEEDCNSLEIYEREPLYARSATRFSPEQVDAAVTASFEWAHTWNMAVTPQAIVFKALEKLGIPAADRGANDV